MKLYELTTAYNSLLDKLYDSEIDEQTLIDTLESLESEIETKADGIAKINAIMDGDLNAIDNEIKRLQSRKQTIKNQQEGLKKYIFTQMKALGIKKIEGDIFTVSIHKNPAKLIITDPEKVPAEYLTLIPERFEINNAALKQGLKDGDKIDGAHLEQGESLQIK